MIKSVPVYIGGRIDKPAKIIIPNFIGIPEEVACDTLFNIVTSDEDPLMIGYDNIDHMLEEDENIVIENGLKEWMIPKNVKELFETKEISKIKHFEDVSHILDDNFRPEMFGTINESEPFGIIDLNHQETAVEVLSNPVPWLLVKFILKDGKILLRLYTDATFGLSRHDGENTIVFTGCSSQYEFKPYEVN